MQNEGRYTHNEEPHMQTLEERIERIYLHRIKKNSLRLAHIFCDIIQLMKIITGHLKKIFLRATYIFLTSIPRKSVQAKQYLKKYTPRTYFFLKRREISLICNKKIGGSGGCFFLKRA